MDDDRGTEILATTWALTSASGVFLAVRLYCKLKTKRSLWWDDHILILSWVTLLASNCTLTVSVSKGTGKHVQYIPRENLSTVTFIGNITGTLSILAAVWSKTSFAITLLRLMLCGRVRFLLWFIIVTINIFMGLNALFMWIRCSPVSKIWNYHAAGTCWASEIYPMYGMFAAGYSGLMDFVLALLGWKIVWKLHMNLREKVGVALAMSLGVFAGATAIVKTITIPTLASPDFSYKSAPLITWGTAEGAVTIMAASIPVLRTLFRDLHATSRNKSTDNRYATWPRNVETKNSNAALDSTHSTAPFQTTWANDSLEHGTLTQSESHEQTFQRNEVVISSERNYYQRGNYNV